MGGAAATSGYNLRELWGRGLSGRALLEQHAARVDSLLQENFIAKAGASGDYALVALGGYGRRELFPYSDVDLMILHSGQVREKALEEMAQAVFYPLWDEGFEVGHAVRTVDECLNDAEKDFFLSTALLSARLVAGSGILFHRLTSDFSARLIEGRRRDFVEEIKHNRDLRHKKFGGNAFLLEPHIKEGPGGLRDIHSMLWTARVMFGFSGMDDMVRAGLFNVEEAERFHQAWEELIQVRNRLHFASGRKNDQLYFEYQTAIAADSGFRDRGGRLAVEQFMREVYRALKTIAATAGAFFEHVDDVFGKPEAAGRTRRIEEGIEEAAGRLRITDPSLLENKPQIGLRLFLHACRMRTPVHHQSRRLIRNRLELIRENHGRKRLTTPFIDIVASGDREIMEQMLDTGLIAAMIPEFERLDALAQHDVYHLYTVDRHLMACVGELGRLREDEAAIFSTLRNPALLFLAGLLHDIGKASGRDHSAAGGEMAGRIGRRLNLSDTECDTLAFLIRNHLFLSHMAQSRDLDDSQFIRDCADRIRDQDRLNMLYLLSIADARATGPAAWNEWKAALLLDLYLRITHTLDVKEPSGPDLAGAAEWMREKLKRMGAAADGFDLGVLPQSYLLDFSPATIAEHVNRSRELAEKEVVLIPEDKGSHWSVTVISRDRTGLLARICGCLALNNLRIRAALIHTWRDGTVVDQIEVKPMFDSDFASHDWDGLRRSLGLAAKNRLGIEHRLAEKNSAVRVRFARDEENKVVIDNSVSSAYTLIEVFSAQIPGLLYSITRAMADFGISIHRAIISTRQDMMVNVFYVIDGSGGKIDSPELVEEVRASLLYASKRHFFK